MTEKTKSKSEKTTIFFYIVGFFIFLSILGYIYYVINDDTLSPEELAAIAEAKQQEENITIFR